MPKIERVGQYQNKRMQNVFLTHSGILAALPSCQNGFAFFTNHGAFRRECSFAEFQYLKNSGNLIEATVNAEFDCELPRWKPIWTVNDFEESPQSFLPHRIQHYYYAAQFPDGTWHFRTYTQHFRNDRSQSHDYLGRPQKDVCVCMLQNVDDNVYIHVAGHSDFYDVLERYSIEVKIDEAICVCASDEKRVSVTEMKARIRRLAEIGYERPRRKRRR